LLFGASSNKKLSQVYQQSKDDLTCVRDNSVFSNLREVSIEKTIVKNILKMTNYPMGISTSVCQDYLQK